jgi:hypothetical protein
VYVERLLQINIATLTALSALILGMGQRNMAMPTSVLLAAIASLVLTDFAPVFRLNRVVTNLLALGAMILAFWQLRYRQGPLQILALANLLVYLQIILLFQKKEFRTYWQLAVLSLLQVIVVAAVFRHEYQFGLFLVVYFFTGLSALALLCLNQEQCRHDPARNPPSKWVPHDAGRLLGDEPLVLVPSVKNPDDRGPLVPELWVRLTRIGIGTLFVTLLMFFAMPRFGRTAWRGAVLEPRQAVGFNDEVALGELGKIIENPQEVMRVSFFDHATSEPYPVRGDIYLRGAVLRHYEDGRWHHRSDPKLMRYRRLRPGESVLPKGLVRQEIVIEPMDREELFCVWPFVPIRRDNQLLYDSKYRRLVRLEQLRSQRLHYELGTTALIDGKQAEVVPCTEGFDLPDLLSMPPSQGPKAVPQLIQKTREWLDGSSVRPEDRYAKARHLERQLRDSGDFQYSLQMQPRNPATDPIEDFVTANPRGHCEYFATALALMLRSQGIPARLVVGYRCDEWNHLGKFFLVRQLHAHAWVEAYLDPGGIPADQREMGDDQRWSNGAWLRLDPTPAGSELGATESFLGRVDKYLNWLDYMWDNYVMEMDGSRQREAIYHPLAKSVGTTIRRLADPGWWREFLAGIGQAIARGFRSLKEGRWISWRGGLVAAIVAIGLILMYRIGRLTWRRVLRWFPSRAARRRHAVEAKVGFYRRLESLLARRGLVRFESQTHRQFAAQAGQVLAQSTGQPQMAQLPSEIVETFYLVRFGGKTLDRLGHEAVEQALRRLEHAVSSCSRADRQTLGSGEE